MNRKLWSNDEKVAIVLEILTDCLTGFWKVRRKDFTDKQIRRGCHPLLEENRQLKELAGQQALIIEAKKSWPES